MATLRGVVGDCGRTGGELLAKWREVRRGGEEAGRGRGCVLGGHSRRGSVPLWGERRLGRRGRQCGLAGREHRAGDAAWVSVQRQLRQAGRERGERGVVIEVDGLEPPDELQDDLDERVGERHHRLGDVRGPCWDTRQGGCQRGQRTVRAGAAVSDAQRAEGLGKTEGGDLREPRQASGRRVLLQLGLQRVLVDALGSALLPEGVCRHCCHHGVELDVGRVLDVPRELRRSHIGRDDAQRLAVDEPDSRLEVGVLVVGVSCAAVCCQQQLELPVLLATDHQADDPVPVVRGADAGGVGRLRELSVCLVEVGAQHSWDNAGHCCAKLEDGHRLAMPTRARTHQGVQSVVLEGHGGAVERDVRPFARLEEEQAPKECLPGFLQRVYALQEEGSGLRAEVSP